MREDTIDPGVLFNPRSRSVRWSGIAGARIRPGTISSRDQSGMGDCVLMDFRKGFFAVSDSSNRFPNRIQAFPAKIGNGIGGAAFAGSGEDLQPGGIRSSFP